MSTPTNEPQLILSTKILNAGSKSEVIGIIETVINDLVRSNPQQVILEFIDSITGILDQFNPMNKTPQQWSNIKMARIQFRQVRNSCLDL
jgi:hypothetical protein